MATKKGRPRIFSTCSFTRFLAWLSCFASSVARRPRTVRLVPAAAMIAMMRKATITSTKVKPSSPPPTWIVAQPHSTLLAHAGQDMDARPVNPSSVIV